MSSSAIAPPTPRRVWQLSWPMMASGMTVPLVGLVDTAVVGRLPGAEFLAGTALAILVFNYLLFGFGFLRMGTTGLVAQAWGRRGEAAAVSVLQRALVLALVLAALVMALHPWLMDLAMWLTAGSPAAESVARSYFSWRVWGVPAIFLRLVLTGWFIAMQRPLAALVMLLWVNVLNALLDIVLVFGLGFGVEGVALASVMGEWCGAAAGLWLLRRHLGSLGPKGRWHRSAVLNLAAYAGLIRVNRDIFIRTLLLVTALALFTARGAALGDVVLAGNAVLLNFFMLLSFGLDGLAHAAEALVGRHWQRDSRHHRALISSLRLTGVASLLVAFAYSGIFAILGEPLVALMTDLPAVREQALAFLPLVLVLPLVSVVSFWLDGVFVGATLSRDMRNTMALSLLVYIAALFFWRDGGNVGLWWSLLLWLALRGAAMAALLPRRLGQLRRAGEGSRVNGH
ncbi:MAG: MATE family efflux transporter [Pseudomonadota bacterium]